MLGFKFIIKSQIKLFSRHQGTILNPQLVLILLLIFQIPSFAFGANPTFRIISLSPNLTEIIYEMNLQDSLVGVSTFSNYPEAAQKIPVVGSYLQPQIEKIIKLQPTHVLVMKEGSPVIKEQLDRAKIPYIFFESKNLEDYKNTVLKLAEVFNQKNRGEELIHLWQKELTKFKILKVHPRRALIQVDHNPMIVAGTDTFLSEALSLCSLKNVFQMPGYAKVSIESIMTQKPDLAVIVGQLNKTNKFKDVKEFYANNPALKNTKLIEGDSDKLSRLTSRFLPEIFKICSSQGAGSN